MDKRKIIGLILIVVVYIVSAGISYFLFAKSSTTKGFFTSPTPSPTVTSGQVVFDKTLPKTQPCPLNGALYSKQQESWWEKHRPLGIMIENHKDARPQSGLWAADVVYEAVAEGGITRFLAVYYCQDAGQVGPVRSARTYFMDFLFEYGDYPLYAHVGGANQPGPADAISQLSDYGWTGYNDLNQFSIGFPVFWRDYDRLGHPAATEHTMYSTTTKLWDFASSSRGVANVDKKGKSWNENFVEYSFKDDPQLSERPKSQSVHLEWWNDYKDYAVDWNYDRTANNYKRVNGAGPHVDKDTNEQLTSKNVVVLFMQESNANDNYENNIHLLYKTKGIGKALVFMDGKQVKGTWKKDGRTSRILLFDSNGQAVKFDRGTIWFEILPTTGVANVL